MRFALIRPPSTQEDEGRHHLVDVVGTLAEAEARKKELDGYYTHEIWVPLSERTVNLRLKRKER